MSYVQSVLQPGEQIRHMARLHWIKFVPGLATLIVAVAIAIMAERIDNSGYLRVTVLIFAAAVGLIGLALVLHAWFVRWITEIAVTDRRVIYKTGFISRQTVEMHMDKIESVDVDQSIFGRILGYGTVTVRGTGSGFEPLKTIEDPLALRNHITGV